MNEQKLVIEREQLQLYKTLGCRNIHDFISPRFIDSSEFEFPIDSSFYNFNLRDRPYPLSSDPIFSKEDKLYLYSEQEHARPLGVSIKTKTSRSLDSANKRLDSNFHYVTRLMNFKSTNKNLVPIVNLASLNSLYRYKSGELENYYKAINNITTLVTVLARDLDKSKRTIYVPIEIESGIPTIGDISRATDQRPEVLMHKFKTGFSILVLEIWKWLTSETRSLFDHLPTDQLHKVNFLIRYRNKVTIVNLAYLYSLSSTNDKLVVTTSVSERKLKKVFYLFILRSLVVKPVSKAMLDSAPLVSKLKNSDIKNMLDNLDALIDEEYITVTDTHKEITINNKTTLTKTEYRNPAGALSDHLDKMANEGTIKKSKYDTLKKLAEFQEKEILPRLRVTKEENTISKADIELPDNELILNKDLLEDTTTAMDTKYIENILDKDILNSIYSLQRDGFIIHDTEIVKIDKLTGKGKTIKFTISDGPNTPYTMEYFIPDISPDGTYKIANNLYRSSKHKGDVVVRKINKKRVGLTTNYGKVFLTRDRVKKNDQGHYIAKQLMKKTVTKEVEILVEGETIVPDVAFSYIHGKLIEHVKSFQKDGWNINLNYHGRTILLLGKDRLDVIEDDKILVGNSKDSYLLIDKDDMLWKRTKTGKLTELFHILTFLDIESTDLPKSFVTLQIYGSEIPVGLLLAYYYGFEEFFKKIGVTYELLDVRKRIIKDPNKVSIKFKDHTLEVSNLDKTAMLLVNGLENLRGDFKEIEFSDIVSTRDFSYLFTLLDITVDLVEAFNLYKNLFIDPMAEDLLRLLDQPITFTELLIYATHLLIDDTYTHPNSMDDTVIRGYERLSGMLYNTLINTVKKHRRMQGNGGNSKLKERGSPLDVIRLFNSDSSSGLVDDTNPISDLKGKEEVTALGYGGRMLETMTKETRGYHISELGVTSEATKDGPGVGVINLMSANPQIANVRGQKKKNVKLFRGHIFSSAALMGVSLSKDDPKRMNFKQIQDAHIRPIHGAKCLPIRMPYDSIFPLRVSEKFAYVARQNGIVTKIDEYHIFITLEDDTKKEIKLGDWTSKEESGGAFKHTVITTLKEGEKFVPNTAIAYDKFFFGRDIFNLKRIVYKGGTTLRTMIVDEDSTFEDSFAIYSGAANKMVGDMMGVNNIKVKNDQTIARMVKIGDKVNADDPLMTIIEDVEGMDRLDEATVALLSTINSSTPKSAKAGVVEKIQVFYNSNFEDLSPSIQKIAKASDKEFRLIHNNKDYNGQVDRSYSVGGKKLEKGDVQIKIYTTKTSGLKFADKAKFFNQLKTTAGEIFEYKITDENNMLVEAKFGTLPIEGRIVNSPNDIGVSTTIAYHHTREILKMLN